MEHSTGANEYLSEPTDASERERLSQFGSDAFCFLGDYVVLRDPQDPRRPFRLGEGGFGVTYKARHRILHVDVALKVLKFDQSDVRFERFQREASALRALHHPHVAGYDHIGIHEGTPYCTMEFCGGGSLYALMKRFGGLSALLVLVLGRELCSALRHAHGEKLIHRDIKPENVMIGDLKSGKPGVKLIDFGLAKAFRDDGSEASAMVSRAGFKGSQLFASPEQFRERKIDHRSDLYSLGMTLWYLHMGGMPPPFQKKSEAEVAMLHLDPAPFDLTGVDPCLQPLLGRLLGKEAGNRFADATAAEAAFERVIQEKEAALGQTLELGELIKGPGGGTPATETAAAPASPDAPGAVAAGAPVPALPVSTTLEMDPRTLSEAYLQCGPVLWESVVGSMHEALSIHDHQKVMLTVVNFGSDQSPALVDRARESLHELVDRHRQLSEMPDYPWALIAPRAMSWFRDGRVAIESEWIEGLSLQELSRSRGRVEFVDVLPLVTQMAGALDYLTAHELPIPGMYDYQVFVSFPASVAGGGPLAESIKSLNLRDCPGVQLKLFPLRFPDEIEQSVSDSANVTGTIGGMAEQGLDGQRPSALLAAKVYRFVDGAPVADAAFSTRAAYTNTRGLGPEANALLQDEIATRQSVSGGCRKLLLQLCRLEGLSPPTELTSKTPPPRTREPSALAATRVETASPTAQTVHLSVPPAPVDPGPGPLAQRTPETISVGPLSEHIRPAPKKRPLVIVAAVVGLVLLTGAGLWAFKNFSSKEADPPVVAAPVEHGKGTLELSQVVMLGTYPGSGLMLRDRDGVVLGKIDIEGQRATVDQFPMEAFERPKRWPLKIELEAADYVMLPRKLDFTQFKATAEKTRTYQQEVVLEFRAYLEMEPVVTLNGSRLEGVVAELRDHLYSASQPFDWELTTRGTGIGVSLPPGETFPVKAELEVPYMKPIPVTVDRGVPGEWRLELKSRPFHVAGLSSDAQVEFEPDYGKVTDAAIRKILEQVTATYRVSAKDLERQAGGWVLPELEGYLKIARSGQGAIQGVRLADDTRYKVIIDGKDAHPRETPGMEKDRRIAEGETSDAAAVPAAQYSLGMEYRKELRDGEALRRGAMWLGFAAEQGDALAQIALGQAYLQGSGVDENPRRGFDWLIKAVEADDDRAGAEACLNLGSCYENGKGVPVDHARAKACYEKAIEKGAREGAVYLGRLLIKKGSSVPDPARAFQLFQEAANKGNTAAMVEIAICYYQGEGGVAEDVEMAKEWFRKAAAKGDPVAKDALRQLDK